jgi:hypothetical protein
MRRRRLLLGAGALALVGLGGLSLFLFLLPDRGEPGINLENFHRLRAGMPLQEVQAIMGRPGATKHLLGRTFQVWQEGSVQIMVLLDDTGRVSHGNFDEWSDDGTGLQKVNDLDEGGVADRLRAWLGW